MTEYIREDEEKKRNVLKLLKDANTGLGMPTIDQDEDDEIIAPKITPTAADATAVSTPEPGATAVSTTPEGQVPSEDIGEEVARHTPVSTEAGAKMISESPEVNDLITKWIPAFAKGNEAEISEEAKTLIPDTEDLKTLFSSTEAITKIADDLDANTVKDFTTKIKNLEGRLSAESIKPILEFINKPNDSEALERSFNKLYPIMGGSKEVMEEWKRKPLTGGMFSKGLYAITAWARTVDDNNKVKIIDSFIDSNFPNINVGAVEGHFGKDKEEIFNKYSTVVPNDVKRAMFDARVGALDVIGGGLKNLENVATPENAAIMYALTFASPYAAFGASMYFLKGIAQNAAYNINEAINYFENGNPIAGRQHIGMFITDGMFMAGIGKHGGKSLKDAKSLYHQPHKVGESVKGDPVINPAFLKAYPRLNKLKNIILMEGRTIRDNVLKASDKTPIGLTIKEVDNKVKTRGSKNTVGDGVSVEYVEGNPIIKAKGEYFGKDISKTGEAIQSALTNVYALNKKKLMDKDIISGDVNYNTKVIAENPQIKYTNRVGYIDYKPMLSEGPMVETAIDIPTWGALPSSVNSRYKNFYKNSKGTFEEKPNEFGEWVFRNDVFYHATDVLGIKELKGRARENTMTYMGEGIETPMVFVSKGAKQAAEFVAGDKYTRKGKKIGPIDIHTVHIKVEKPWEYWNPSDVADLISHGEGRRQYEAAIESNIAGGLTREQSTKYINDALKAGEWSIIERFTDVIKGKGYDALTTGEWGVKNYGMFNPWHIKSINNFSPYKYPKLMDTTSPLAKKTMELHAKSAEGMLFEEVYKKFVEGELVIGDANREFINNVKSYNEFTSVVKGKPTKAKFSKYIQDILKPETTEQKTVAKSIIDSYGTMESNHAKSLKMAKELKTGEGGMPRPPVGKNAEAYAGNMNLKTVPKAQRPFYENIYRHIGENIDSQMRAKVTWDDTRRAGSKASYIQNQVERIFRTEEIITKDGKVNPNLQVQARDVYGYKLITSALVDVYKHNPTPQNLAALIKAINSTSAVISTAGRALQATKIKVEVNAGITALDGMLREISLKDVKPNWLDVLVEHQRNMKLMSTSSVVRSVVGNSAHFMLNVLDMPVSAVNNAIIANMSNSVRKAYYEGTGETPPVTDIRSRFQSDIVEFARGTFHGLNAGIKKALALLKEDPEAVAKYSLYNREMFKFQNAISGKWGTIIRTPQRAQGAIDVAVREPAITGFIYRIANKIAHQEGHQWGSKAWDKRTREIIENPSDSHIKEAMNSAEYITFQNELGVMGKQANLLRSGNFGQLGQLIVPFFNTPVNLAKVGLHRSPFGFLTPNFYRGIAEGYKTGDWGRFSDASARIQTGTALTLMLGQAALKYYDGEVEGSWQNLSKDERDFRTAQGRIPNSVRFTKEDGSHHSWSYQGYEPMAAYLRFLGGWNRGKDINKHMEENGMSGSAWNPINEAGKAMAWEFLENPFLQGVTDIQKMGERLASSDSKAGAYIYGTNFVRGTVMPNFLSQSRKVLDPVYRERPEGFIDAFFKQVPGLTQRQLPRLGFFGEPLAYPDPKGGIVALRRTSNVNLNYDAMYNELEKIGVDKLPEMISSSKPWAKGMGKEQLFVAKHVGGEFFGQILQKMILNDDGTVKENWASMPALARKAIVAKFRNITNEKLKMEFMPSYIFDKTEQVRQLNLILKTVGYDEPDDEIINEVKLAIYREFNQQPEIKEEFKERATKLKKKKEEEFYMRRKEPVD